MTIFLFKNNLFSGPIPEDTLYVGKTYSNLPSIIEDIEEYEKKNFVKFWRRSSRKLDSYKKRCTKKFDKLTPTFKENFDMVEMTYTCIHGGRKFQCRSTGKRPNTK